MRSSKDAYTIAQNNVSPFITSGNRLSRAVSKATNNAVACNGFVKINSADSCDEFPFRVHLPGCGLRR